MSIQAPSRRAFLKVTAAAGGGLLLGLQLPSLSRASVGDPAPFVPNAFLRIDPQGNVTAILPHVEVGQGVYTSALQLIGEELELGLDQIEIEAAPPDLKKYIDPLLGDQATGGSASTRADWDRLRQAGATARVLLIAAAAKKWGVDPSSCRAERGVIHHEASGNSVPYGDVASDAAQLPVPAKIALKDPSQFKLIGRSAKRVDTPAKANGTALYGIDIMVPNMRFGTLAISPVIGGKLKSLNEAAARSVAGVSDVVVNDTRDVVAVIGSHMWAAKQGLDALDPQWDAGPNGDVTLASIVEALDHASQSEGVIAKKIGDAGAAIAVAAQQVSAIYQSPFLSHSSMEPLNCVLHVQADRAELWVGTQVPVRAQKAVARLTGLQQDKVEVHNQLVGGAFGRRLDIDSIEVAASIAKHLAYPVKLVWTREQDLQHDYYRPYYYDRVAAGLDVNGKITGRTHRVTGPSILARWAPEFFKNGLDFDAVECAAETPYDIPAEHVDYVRHEPRGMNTSWWRGVGPTHNVFVVESFIDELAYTAKQDPVEFRRGLLAKNPRALAVLNLAAEKAGWGEPLPRGIGRGVALQFAFGSYLCCVLEVEVSSSGQITLHRGTVAIDCGLTVNPDTVEAQIQGGLIFGLSAAMFNEITIAGGAIEQSNFNDYRMMRINEAPKVDVFRIESGEKPGGIGETGTAAAAPVLGNAIFAATGKRLRRLPFASQLSGGS